MTAVTLWSCFSTVGTSGRKHVGVFHLPATTPVGCGVGEKQLATAGVVVSPELHSGRVAFLW